MPENQSSRLCPVCGGDIPPPTNGIVQRYCCKKCRDTAYREEHKERLRADARERMRLYRKTKEGARKRKEYQKSYAPAYRRREDVMERDRLRCRLRYPHRYDAHVKLWRRLGLDWRVPRKHCAHVSAWKNHLRTNPGASARYFKSIGQPWRNLHLSDRCKYAVRYRIDLEFRLGEINRQTWRKKELAARDDGTINFWQLMRERKTCPYCGTKITKENAVADHMDPVKHGGANGQHNLTICCRSCNTRKAGRPFVEWMEMLPDDRRNAALLWYKRKHGHGPEQSSLCFEFKAA